MSYVVEKHRVYQDGDLYNGGEGIHASTDDLAQAELWFAVFSQQYQDRHEEKSVELRENGVVIKSYGPPMSVAMASMNRAYRAWRASAASRTPAGA